MILVTHDLPVVAQVCDRAAVMYAGEIVEMGAMSTIFHDPRHPYTRMLFAATPDLLGDDEVISIPGRAAAARPRARRLPVPTALRLGLRAVRDRAPAPLEPVPRPRGALPSQRRDDDGGRVVSTRRRPADARLLEVEGLVTRYPIPRGLLGTIARRPKLTVHAVDGVSFSRRRGRDAGAGRRVRLRQDDHRPDGDADGRDSDAGSIRFRGTDITRLGAREMRPLRREIQIIYQDPYESLDPRFRSATRSRSRCWSTGSDSAAGAARRRSARRWSGPA